MAYLCTKIFAVAVTLLTLSLNTAQADDSKKLYSLSKKDPVLVFLRRKLKEYFDIKTVKKVEIIPGSAKVRENVAKGSEYNFKLKVSDKTKTRICEVYVKRRPNSKSSLQTGSVKCK